MPLSIILWLPLAAVVIGALLPRSLTPRVALLGSLATLGLSIYLIVDYTGSSGGLRHVTDVMWIRQLGMHYKLGVDGLNVLLLVLTALLFAIAFAASNLREWPRPATFYFWIGLAESAVLGAFLAQDLALFVIFFDLMLIPFYFLTGQWGGRRRVPATLKLVIYTLVGSLLMLAAAVATGVLSTPDGGTISFALSDLARHHLSSGRQEWVFLLFAAAFLVKMPAFPLHGWMPDGYRAMPLEVLTAFSGVLAKVGAYGFLRIALPLFPQASVHYQMLMLLIALASILYGSAMAFTTTDTRLIAGYSSVAQLGFITLGIFSLRPSGAQGAILQMVNHGLVMAALLLIVGMLARRAGGSEDLRDMGGIATRAPVFAGLFIVVSFATLAMPGSANFIGEFLILLGVFQTKIVIAIVAFTGVALAAVYMLRAYIRSMHNRVGPNVESHDLRFGEGLVLASLVAVILAIAVYPHFALHRSQRSVVASIAPARAAESQTSVAALVREGWTPYAPLKGGTP
jgi:NADH-quinone oxidoreductase subunit M